MKRFLLPILLLLTGICSAQKYALLDKQMIQPVAWGDGFSMQQSFAGLFAVEKEKLKEFVIALENIAKQLTNSKKTKPEAFKFNLANTTFLGVKISLKEEDRLDVVLTSTVGPVKSSMHLCDAKISNGNNAFFVNTWARYIRDNMGSVGVR